MYYSYTLCVMVIVTFGTIFYFFLLPFSKTNNSQTFMLAKPFRHLKHSSMSGVSQKVTSILILKRHNGFIVLLRVIFSHYDSNNIVRVECNTVISKRICGVLKSLWRGSRAPPNTVWEHPTTAVWSQSRVSNTHGRARVCVA